MGWEVRDELAPDRVRGALREHGVALRDLPPEEALARRVDEFIAATTPPASRWRFSTALASTAQP